MNAIVELCKQTSSVNPRDLSEIQQLLESHQWKSMSSDKSPWGIISRFACENCEDEYVVMVTSARNIEEEVSKLGLEVSAGDMVIN
jgi:hypothetical protein